MNLERHLLAAQTPKYISGAAGTPRGRANRVKGIDLQTQPFKVAHQRVTLDVDMATKSIQGFTELIIVPLSGSLKTVRLDAREMQIKEIYVNGSRLTNYIHRDMLYINDPERFEDAIDSKHVSVWDMYSREFNMHLHHLLREKLNYIFGEVSLDPLLHPDRIDILNTEELRIALPENLRLEVSDKHNSPFTPSRSKGTLGGEAYTPISIGIEYELLNPKSGFNFVCDGDDKRLWHAYTTNSDYHVSTSSWVPCIDNLWERSTWLIEVSIPRTIKDIGKSGKDTDQTKQQDEHEGDEHDDDDDDDPDNEDLVVCTGDMANTKEMPHSSDVSRKTVSWSIFNPVCAHHVGFAVGCFKSMELADLDDKDVPNVVDEDNEEEVDVDKEESSLVVMLYYLAGWEEQAKNTCIFANNALNFFAKEFGAFPFNSYGIIFVDGPSYPYNNFSGLSVVSDKVLYPPNVIEPMLTTTEEILECITSQWSGINMVPLTYNDFWVTIGIAKFMALQYLEKLMGVNEFRFQIRKKMEAIVAKDQGKPPIGNLTLQAPISEYDLEFVRLKAPMVLFILDRRMTKTDKLFGLFRVLPKIFLQAMSSDLPNGGLSTLHFQHVCERVNRNRLETFFRQWVYGVGTPSFQITHRFNKKRMLIEVVIRQTQHHRQNDIHSTPDTFIENSLSFLESHPTHPQQNLFLGPMTIRVHEADGTPYEHIVDIKDTVVKFDVMYNTRLRRLRKNKDEDGNPIQVFTKLGDVLESEEDVRNWHFTEWPKRDEDVFDAFEWLRVDTDLEWIGTFDVRQADYMYALQIQQDRDIEAQIAAAEFFGRQEKATSVYCTILTRTLMDPRYFYGVRIAAARALASLSNTKNNFMGIDYIIKSYKTLFCFENSSIPMGNVFGDFGRFFLQKEVPLILSAVKDDDGVSPSRVKSMLFNMLKYNDNSNNEFQDCFYINGLVHALTKAIIPTRADKRFVDFHLERETNTIAHSKELTFISKVVDEINRIQKLDAWMPSYHNVVSIACVREKIMLARHNLLDINFEELLGLTRPANSLEVRVLAFEGLFLLGGLKNKHILKYYLETILLDQLMANSRNQLIQALVTAVGEAAIHGTPSMIDDPEFKSLEKILETGTEGGGIAPNNMVVIEEAQSSEMASQRDAVARATIKGAIELLRRDLSVGRGLRDILWELLHTSLLSYVEKKNVFFLCEILYQEVDSFPVIISVPCVPFEELKKKIVAKNLGGGQVVIKREGRFKISLSTKILLGSSHKYGSRQSNRNFRTRSNTNVETADAPPPEPKVTLKLSHAPLSKPVEIEEVKLDNVVVKRDPAHPNVVKIKFANRSLAEITQSGPVVTNNNYKVTVWLSRFEAGPYLRLCEKTGKVELSNKPFDSASEKPGNDEAVVQNENAEEDGEPMQVEEIETVPTMDSVSEEMDNAPQEEKKTEPDEQNPEEFKNEEQEDAKHEESPERADVVLNLEEPATTPRGVPGVEKETPIEDEEPSESITQEKEAASEITEKPKPKLKLKLSLKR